MNKNLVSVHKLPFFTVQTAGLAVKIPQEVIVDGGEILCSKIWQSLNTGRDSHARNKLLSIRQLSVITRAVSVSCFYIVNI